MSTYTIHMIRHIVEPRRLLLVWQPLDANRQRTRRVVGELLRENSNVTLRYLSQTLDFAEALESGFTCFPAFPKIERDYTEGILETFSLRLPPRSRLDFKHFLESIRISPDTQVSDFALLGYSEARLPGDGFSIVNPFDDFPVPCEFLSEIAGFRHYRNSDAVYEIGMALNFEIEKDNPIEQNAIAVIADDKKIGYVNRVQLQAVKHWLSHNKVRAFIERNNGRPGWPRVYMFVEVS